MIDGMLYLTNPKEGAKVMPTIPSQAWIDVHLSEGRAGIMRFVLVWRGNLGASGNKGKGEDVARIRDELSHQMAFLWGSVSV